MFIYGRYVEIVAPPLLALAVAWLMRATTRPRIGVVLVALAAATAVAVGLRETFEPARASNRWDIAALPSRRFSSAPRRSRSPVLRRRSGRCS